MVVGGFGWGGGAWGIVFSEGCGEGGGDFVRF